MFCLAIKVVIVAYCISLATVLVCAAMSDETFEKIPKSVLEWMNPMAYVAFAPVDFVEWLRRRLWR